MASSGTTTAMIYKAPIDLKPNTENHFKHLHEDAQCTDIVVQQYFGMLSKYYKLY